MKYIFLVSMLLGQFAFAGFNGDWIGFGSWKFKGEEPGTHCDTMSMRWVESKNTIAIESGFFDCQVVTMELDRTEWKIEDHKLFDQDQKEVGTYKDNTFEVYMPSPNQNTTIHIWARREANHYDYKEIWYNKYEKVYVIEGRLFTGSAK